VLWPDLDIEGLPVLAPLLVETALRLVTVPRLVAVPYLTPPFELRLMVALREEEELRLTAALR
jgi:hypothetical protein